VDGADGCVTGANQLSLVVATEEASLTRMVASARHDRASQRVHLSPRTCSGDISGRVVRMQRFGCFSGWCWWWQVIQSVEIQNREEAQGGMSLVSVVG
jgi:hypothetical protein